MAVEEAAATRQSHGPISGTSRASRPIASTEWPAGAGERLILTHIIDSLDQRLAARDARRAQSGLHDPGAIHVQLLAEARGARPAVGRHRARSEEPAERDDDPPELLKQQLSSTDLPPAIEHLSIIAAQIRRLDEVVQGFLKFTRPEDLKLQPAVVSALVSAIMPVVMAEARKNKVDVRWRFPASPGAQRRPRRVAAGAPQPGASTPARRCPRAGGSASRRRPCAGDASKSCARTPASASRRSI